MEKSGIQILSIGDEILIGQIVNTNATWMGELLHQHNFKVRQILSISDNEKDMIDAFENATHKADIVLITGGLGPTKDDRTKSAICQFFDTHLELNEMVLKHVHSFFKARGKELTELNRLQAMVPQNCEVIFNPIGTAPGLHLTKNGTHFFFMPGVPYEMKGIMQSDIIPFLKANIKTKAKAQITILTSGMGESFLAEKISPWEDSLPLNASLAYLPAPGKVRLRLTIEDESQEKAEAQLQELTQSLKSLISPLIYGYNHDTLEEIVGKLLKDNNLTLSLAESCTGGLIASRITSIAGSSAYFKGAIVAYSNEMKSEILKIDPQLIENHGAVSEEVALEMAKNARLISQSSIALSVTGIAGPDGGSIQKPVGTVWIGFSDDKKTFARHFQFGGERNRNIEWSVQSALNLLRTELLTSFG